MEPNQPADSERDRAPSPGRGEGGVASSAAASRWSPAAVIAAVFIGMLWMCWFRWPDVLIDFSREIYIAWQLAEGKTLYTDIAYFNGPFSPYLNALWFHLFGVSLRALVICNLAILGLSVWLLWRLLIQMSGRFAATLACVLHLTVFSLGHLTPMGNFNFVCPYSHEMTHGLTLTLAAMLCLARFARDGRLRFLVAAGFLVGLTLLTRAELALGAALATGAGLAVVIWIDPPRPTNRLRVVGAFLGPVVLVPAAAFCLLRLAMPAAQALRGTLGSWLWVFDSGITSMPFYRQNLGTLDATGNLKRLALSTAWCALALAPFVVLSLLLRDRRLRRTWIPAALCLAAAGILSWRWVAIPWADVGRPLPLAALTLFGVVVFGLFAKRREPGAAARLVPRLMMTVLALALLMRMALNAQVFSIGFVLALPATMLVVLALVDWLPEAITRASGYGDLFRGAAVGLLLAMMFAHLQFSWRCVALKTTRMGEGADAFYADVRGLEVQAALKTLARDPSAEQTLAVMPQGLMINYFARRPNPSAFVNVMPPEVASAGEGAVLQDLESRSPDAIILLGDDFTRRGFRFHSQIYAPNVAAWVAQNYRVATRIEAPPPGPTFLNMVLLRRAGAAP